ncbi:MAG: hypothetical protein IJU90_03770 [Bacteroidales bacterium]|nr:hypothetical protein [Bacteroidales bacterium]
MSETERTKLRQLQIESELHPETHCLRSGTWVKNAEKTADELPLVGNSWIEYWQIFTIQDIPRRCPLCGNPMSEKDVDGCHIQIEEGGLLKCYSKKKYIIPGHHGCNMKLGAEYQMKFGITVVEAIKK